MGLEDEFVISIKPILPYEERLPCLEPICTANGIESI
jgi:protein ImuB